MTDLFWLSDEQWAAIEPHLPHVHTGPVRVDDRRIISGIIHVLREGCRWRGMPTDYGPRTTVYNRYNRWSKRGLWQNLLCELVGAGGAPGLLMIDSSAVKAHRCASGAKGGENKQAIGKSRGGRTTKIHALVDAHGRPHALLPTGGQVADIKGAATLLSATQPVAVLIGDKGYDAGHLRHFLDRQGTTPVIPNKINRLNLYPFDAVAYKDRNVIERTYCRLKDFRRIATRYDKLARNFLAGLCLVTAICYWIK